MAVIWQSRKPSVGKVGIPSRRALKDAGNVRVTTRSFPKLNHLFQTCETGALSEYSRIEETMAPVVFKTIVEWVVEQTSRP